MKIAIVGLSHQGYVWNIFLGKFYKNIGVFDTQEERIFSFKKKLFPNYIIKEKNFEKYKNAISKNTIAYENFSKIKNYDLIIVTEDVVIEENLSKNNKLVKKNINRIIENVGDNSKIILMSQINPGDTRNFFFKLKRKKNCSLFYIPDVLTIGTAIETLEYYKNIIIGGENTVPKNSDKVFLNKFFKKIKKNFYYVMLEEAELVKEAIQLKLSLDITFANLLSSMSEKYNLSLKKMTDFMKLDSRFSRNGYWRPGLGFGGGHIERGLNYFKDDLPANDSKFVQNLLNYNELRINWVYKNLKNKKIKKILLWGATYKKNTSSTFRSPAKKLIIKYKNKYKYAVFDPGLGDDSDIIQFYNVKLINNEYSYFKETDCLIVMSDWEEFRINKQRLKNFIDLKHKLVLDPFRMLIHLKKDLLRLKINYKAIGYE